jgi:hypothetical protein
MNMTEIELLEDLWDSVDFPVLRATVSMLQKPGRNYLTAGQIAGELKMDKIIVVQSITRLKDDYLEVKDHSSDNQQDWWVTGVNGNALVVTGVWPSPDRLIARLEDELEKEIEQSAVNSSKHTKLKALLDSLKNVAEGVTKDVLSEVILKATGMKP